MKSYPGNELELFSEASVWKAYCASLLRPYLGRRVLEVGSGIGATTRCLVNRNVQRWVCLEPDQSMSGELSEQVAAGQLPAACEVHCGTIEQLGDAEPFDSILYIDVLEHIEDDRRELESAAGILSTGGHLVVLAPAHGWLYSPFDAAIGHFRRYTRRMLRELSPTGLTLVKLDYLDSVGLCASLGNRLLLRKSLPSKRQIYVWDKFMVPLSKVADTLTLHRFGKSVLAVWQQPDSSR